MNMDVDDFEFEFINDNIDDNVNEIVGHDETDDEYEEKITIPETDDNNCCLLKCMMNFDDEFKSRLKLDLSKISKSEKRIYLFAMISINEERINCSKMSKSSKYFHYTVKEYGVSRSVCKKAFLILHDTTPALLRTLCNQLSTNHLIPVDKRGRHHKRATIPEETKELIKSHFFQTMDSPDVFKCTKKKFGLPNINQLWLDFKQKYCHLSRSTYSKYVSSFLTPEILQKFMCANEAKLILLEIKKYEKRISVKKIK